MKLINEFVIQYNFGSAEDAHWEDETSDSLYRFDTEDAKSRELALAAAQAYVTYCNYMSLDAENGEHSIDHRCVHRITSDAEITE